jgi:hypothetical protein
VKKKRTQKPREVAPDHETHVRQCVQSDLNGIPAKKFARIKKESAGHRAFSTLHFFGDPQRGIASPSFPAASWMIRRGIFSDPTSADTATSRLVLNATPNKNSITDLKTVERKQSKLFCNFN